MGSANLGLDTVAFAVSVATKTVERWLAGREPRARHRWAVASLLKRSEAYLWPDATAGEVELVLAYTHRSDVEPAVWWDLFSSAEREIDLLAYAALFLPEQHISLVRMLKEKAAGGCSIRIVLGDPTSPKILERGEEEQFGEGIVSRSQVALLHYKPLADDPGVHIRVHGPSLYNASDRVEHAVL